MFYNTNTWALSPKAIFLRLSFLILLGYSMLYCIDRVFEPRRHMDTKPAMVHQPILQQDSVSSDDWHVFQ